MKDQYLYEKQQIIRQKEYCQEVLSQLKCHSNYSHTLKEYKEPKILQDVVE